jgi:hypothetical protein
MKTVLVVTEPFGGYERGAIIDDPKTIANLLDSEHAGHVVKTQIPDTPPFEATKD